MPTIAPLVKVDSCREMGANVILHGMSFDETRDHAMDLAKERNLIYINGFDHPDIIAGQGSLGVEILEDVPDVDYIIVPVGGGGLIAGITAAVKHLKPSVKIIVSKLLFIRV
jgi:threonine dehydratase